MRLKKTRQILKSLADDTRLRIINLLHQEELNVSQLRKILGSTQSNLSKHLTRLRLTGMVSDKREGANVYYYLTKSENKMQRELIYNIIKILSGLETFKKDLRELRKLKSDKKKL